jgi:hypothetical protein
MSQESMNSDDMLIGAHEEHITKDAGSRINENIDMTVSTTGAEVGNSRPPSEAQEQSELARE